MSDREIKQYLIKLKKRLLKCPCIDAELTIEWKKSFPKSPGVYAVIKSEKIIYVGETGSLSNRMNDLRNTKNHTIRRSIGEMLFSKRENYVKASSKKSYPDDLETELEEWMKKTLRSNSLKRNWEGRS